LVIIDVFVYYWICGAILAVALNPFQILFLGNDAALAELNGCLQIVQASRAHLAGYFFLAA